MRILIDEDLPRALEVVFFARGFEVQRVKNIPTLRGQPDEVIFDFAAHSQSIIVTGDLDFPNPQRFPIDTLPGMMLLRFPNEMPVDVICEEVTRLIADVAEKDFSNLLIIEPGHLRIRALHSKIDK